MCLLESVTSPSRGPWAQVGLLTSELNLYYFKFQINLNASRLLQVPRGFISVVIFRYRPADTPSPQTPPHAQNVLQPGDDVHPACWYANVPVLQGRTCWTQVRIWTRDLWIRGKSFFFFFFFLSGGCTHRCDGGSKGRLQDLVSAFWQFESVRTLNSAQGIRWTDYCGCRGRAGDQFWMWFAQRLAPPLFSFPSIQSHAKGLQQYHGDFMQTSESTALFIIITIIIIIPQQTKRNDYTLGLGVKIRAHCPVSKASN